MSTSNIFSVKKGFALPLIVLGIFVVLVSAVGIYFYSQSTKNPDAFKTDEVKIKPSPAVANSSPSSTPTSSPNPTATWKTYKDQYIAFQYPNNWNPKTQILCCGAVLETVNLGVPGVSEDQTLSFGTPDIKDIKGNDVVSETRITIASLPGYKWIRKGNNYTSYDYCTQGHYKDAGSFCLHFTSASDDKILEGQLDNLSNSIKFTN